MIYLERQAYKLAIRDAQNAVRDALLFPRHFNAAWSEYRRITRQYRSKCNA